MSAEGTSKIDDISDEIPLWEGRPPGSEGWQQEETVVEGISSCPGAVRNVVEPTVVRYRGPGRTARATVVVPGGGFRFLSMENEGREVAGYLVDHGLDVYLLKYRVAETGADEETFRRDTLRSSSGASDRSAAVVPLAVADAAKAVARARADGYTQVAMVGFSAGARVTAELAMTGAASGPDAAGIIYGPTVPPQSIAPTLPPAFLAVAADDLRVDAEASLSLYKLWKAHGGEAELHVFQRGGHGFGMRAGLGPASQWAALFTAWLDLQLPSA